jgi:UDP-N-acetylmuramoyl-tripeptide--D-alanyl-D-alanine ligase
MTDLCIHDLAEIIGGRLTLAELPPLGGPWEPVGCVVTDAQKVQPGDVLLVLSQGQQRYAGSIELAFERGALGVIAQRRIEPWAGRFSIHVDDAQRVAWQLARAARERFGGRVIAVAGAVGKTIAGAMVDAVLRESAGGWWAEDQTNDALPLNILSLDANARYAVFELHANQRGQLDDLAHVCCPHLGVMVSGADGTTSASSTNDDVSQARELLAALPDDGCAVVSGEAARYAREFAHGVQVRTYGRGADCDVRASHVYAAEGHLTFAVDGQLTRLAAWGRHWLTPALAAWSVGRSFGIREKQISERLSNCVLPGRRCHVTCSGGVTLIDDTQCRSQSSLQAGLQLLQTIAAPGRRIAVCGELSQGESFNAALYRRWGEEAVTMGGADLVLACGAGRRDIVAGARSAGKRAGDCQEFSATQQLTAAIENLLAPGDAVLCKGVPGEWVDTLAQGLEQRRTVSAAAA